jgi:hypothetical protein
MKSVFVDKKKVPTAKDLQEALGATFKLWEAIVAFVKKSYPGAVETWNFPGEKYGWSFRISDKKRVLVYLLPRDGFFKVAFVFGQKATDEILKSGIAESIKTEIKNAKVYAEGRGIRIDVKSKPALGDVKELIKIKISN